MASLPLRLTVVALSLVAVSACLNNVSNCNVCVDADRYVCHLRYWLPTMSKQARARLTTFALPATTAAHARPTPILALLGRRQHVHALLVCGASLHGVHDLY